MAENKKKMRLCIFLLVGARVLSFLFVCLFGLMRRLGGLGGEETGGK